MMKILVVSISLLCLSTTVFADILDNASKLLRLGELIHGIRIKYSNLFEANQLILEDRADISKILNRHLKASSWSTNYGTLFRAVTMERYLVSFLLFFIILVAVFNIVSALAMTVREKQSQIAILMTLGLSNRRIKNIFLYFGSLIGLIGGLLGLSSSFSNAGSKDIYHFVC